MKESLQSTLKKPRKAYPGGFRLLVNAPFVQQYKPHFENQIDPDRPLRKSMVAPTDNGAFIKPVKQCFIKNPRLSPMSRIMLCLLVGWAGQGGSINTTIGVIGKHLSRCRRQVYRLLKDAREEGYLYYTRRKDKFGRYSGISIFLNFGAIRSEYKPKSSQPLQRLVSHHGTLKSDINTNTINNREEDKEIWSKLAKFAVTLGYLDEKKEAT